jgi:hypothetical protein
MDTVENQRRPVPVHLVKALQRRGQRILEAQQRGQRSLPPVLHDTDIGSLEVREREDLVDRAQREQLAVVVGVILGEREGDDAPRSPW